MTWQEQLQQLETSKQWDQVITLMEMVLAEHCDSLEAYLRMLYFLMNLLVEEQFDFSKHDYYAALLLKYFKESWAKFSNDPEYLYYAGRIGVMSPWYFDLDRDDVDAMIDKAAQLAPQNLVYAWNYYSLDLSIFVPEECEKKIWYVELIFQPGSSIRTELELKGSLGLYILGMMEEWGERVLMAIQRFREGKLTARQAFNATIIFIKSYNAEFDSNDLSTFINAVVSNARLGGGVWLDWCNVIADKSVFTSSEAFEVMIQFLKKYNTKTLLPGVDAFVEYVRVLPPDSVEHEALQKLWKKCTHDALKT